jgi:uncharacterized protein YcbX
VRVSSLRIYPVKSTAGIDVPEAVVHPWGLENDRRWMVVDLDGLTLTPRVHRRLLQISVSTRRGGAIDLAAAGLETLHVDVPRRDVSVPVTMSRVGHGVSAGTAADDWLSAFLDQPVRLVWLDDPRRRTVGASHGGRPGDPLNLSDTGPILLTSTSSLDRLNEWLGQTAAERDEPPPEQLPMLRFRPNVVVDGIDPPFAEDDWKLVRIGDVELRFGEHCDRCAVPTIDPTTLTSSKEPTRTLALHRQWDHQVFFGIRLIPVTTGVIRLDDQVDLV